MYFFLPARSGENEGEVSVVLTMLLLRFFYISF